MKISSKRQLPIALALALCFGMAAAQSGSSGAGTSMTGGAAAPAAQPGTGTRNAETTQDDKLARADRKFIQDAAASGMFEVQAGRLGSTKAVDPQVKSYAAMLVDEHTAANSELVQLANSRKVELPAAPPRAMRREVENLGKKSGAEFDREFVREVGIKAHEKDIKEFQKASEKVKDPQLKAWIDKTLPTLRQHLAQAQKLPQGNAAAMGNRGAPGGTGGAAGANKTGS